MSSLCSHKLPYNGALLRFEYRPCCIASSNIAHVWPVAVFVDSYSGEVTGDMPYRGSVMWTIRMLHSLNFFGANASMVIEIIGGWSILLVLAGLYLWWPRGRRGGVLSVRGRPRKRVFWRDLHAVTGIFVGGFILFLAARRVSG